MSSEDQVEVSHGSWRAKASGRAAVLSLLVLGLAGFVGYLIFAHDAKADKFEEEMRGATTETNKRLDALMYVLSLPQERREKLNLAEPQLIRDMRR